MPNWSGGLSGLTGGALAGGSLGGVPGGIIGGVVGGLGGLFGGDPQDEQRKKWEQMYGSIGQDPAAQVGPGHQADYSGFRDNQSAMIGRLEAMSRGEGPSVSREMLKEATDRNTASQMAMAQSGRGNPALAAQNAANNVGMLGAQAGQAAALGRVQEQTNAYNQLGMSLYGARGADEDINRFNATSRNYADQFNASAQNDRYGQNMQGRLQALSGMSGNQGPAMGDQILAGGSGLASFLAAQRANNRGGNPLAPGQMQPQDTSRQMWGAGRY